ncbi:MAG: DUF262 domain-containing HNH endonuclease family protein [Prevotella sp.]|nr:DUF262 domain-containing HNH endonuclease family protein [Prevotella sp.]
MKANDLFLLKVFSTHTVFEIPYYQRAYVWGEDNWKRFLEDMENISLVEKPYFIGSLILKQKETETGSTYSDVRVVIDGQQRLTTITIFFKVLSLKRNRPQIFNDFLITLSDESDEREISIHHNHIDKEAFNKIVNLTEPLDLSVDENGKKIEVHNRIIQMYNYFNKNLNVDKISSDKVKRLLHFVVIDLGSEENEQQIFDTINSLGVTLTTSELLKNYLFDEKNEDKYNKYWKPVFEADEEQKKYWDQIVYSGTKKYHLIDLFLYALLMIKMRGGDYSVSTEDKLEYEKVAKLFPSYKDFVAKYMGRDKGKLMVDIYKSASLFKEKFNPNCKKESVTSDPGLERVNLMMFALDYTVMLPYILYVLMYAEPDEQTKIFDYIETFMMRRSIARLETRGYNALFTDGLITNRILTAEELKAYVNRDRDATYRAAKQEEIKNGIKNIVYINRQALGFLYMLESRLRSDKLAATQLFGIGNYSLEHLLPKKWRQYWDVPENEELAEQTDDALYTFGNLAIIPGSLNTSISNAPWSVKLAGKGNKEGLLKNAKGLITLDEYLELPEWNLETIRYRAKKLYQQILATWSEPWDVQEEDF